MNLRDGSFLFFLSREDPGSLIDLEEFDSKIVDPNELSLVDVKDVVPPLCDGYPRAAS